MSPNQRPRFSLRYSQSPARARIRQKCHPVSGAYSDDKLYWPIWIKTFAGKVFVAGPKK